MNAVYVNYEICQLVVINNMAVINYIANIIIMQQAQLSKQNVQQAITSLRNLTAVVKTLRSSFE